MRIIDLSNAAEEWLAEPSASDAFTAWIDGLPPEIQVAFSPLGIRPTDPDWEPFVADRLAQLAPARGAILDNRRRHRWQAAAARAAERAEQLVGDPLSDIDLILLPGLGLSNAVQGLWDGRGLAFIFVEHFLGDHADCGLLALDDDALAMWATHEVGHAVHYTTASPAPGAPQLGPGDDPFAFWQTLDRLPLSWRLADEGFAVLFSHRAFPALPRHVLLGMTPEQTAWLDTHCDRLLAARHATWQLDSPDPSPDWLADCLYGMPGQVSPPWTIAQPPERWGYYAGLAMSRSSSNPSPPPIPDYEDAEIQGPRAGSSVP